MSLDAHLRAAFEAALDEGVRSARPVGGGSINEVWHLALGSGRELLLKARADAVAADFQAEAAGLRWLARAEAVRAPEVLGLGEDPAWLALAWVAPGELSPSGAEELGRGLAALHAAGAERPGALPPGSPDALLRLGSVEVELRPAPSWPELYAEQLLMPLVERAGARGALDSEGAAAIAAACERIGELAGPPEPPARLHGDLWSGNVHAASDGSGWLIDPAAYGGHREVDLAMLRLFGAPSERIIAAYDEAYPLADGHLERVALWQLLPLLVHAVLFGGGYGESAAAAARRYA